MRNYPFFHFSAAMLLASLLVFTGCNPQEAEEKEDDESIPAENEPEGTVILSDTAFAEIQTTKIATGSGVIRTRFPGTIEFNKNKTASVTSPLEGKLLEWSVEPGQSVGEGEVLARVENPQNLGRPIEIKSPLAGEIVDRLGAIGGPITTTEPMFVVSDLGTVWAYAEVRETMTGHVLKDLPAEVRVLAFPDDVFPAEFFIESASVQRESRTIDYLLKVPNPERRLRAGMFAYISMATEKVEDAILLPGAAVQTVDGESVVFVQQPEPMEFLLTKVKLGPMLDDTLQVLDGLNAGDTVATDGSFLLKSEYLKAELADDDD